MIWTPAGPKEEMSQFFKKKNTLVLILNKLPKSPNQHGHTRFSMLKMKFGLFTIFV